MSSSIPASSPTGTPPAADWGEFVNPYVVWVGNNTFNQVKDWFLVQATGPESKRDGTLSKIARIFALVLASIVLLPWACINSVSSWFQPTPPLPNKSASSVQVNTEPLIEV
ncbi:MAG: hypothetical protein WCF19_04175 [Chlamydiales bacterium]